MSLTCPERASRNLTLGRELKIKEEVGGFAVWTLVVIAAGKVDEFGAGKEKRLRMDPKG